MRLVFWGMGAVFSDAKRQMDFLKEVFTDEIVAYVDSNPQLWETQIEEKQIMSPEKVKEISYDKIVITSVYEKEIKSQLIGELGVEIRNIITFQEYRMLKYAEYSYSKRYGIDSGVQNAGSFSTDSIVVYTAITGNYDVLKEPDYCDPQLTYVCFTNNRKLTSKVWEVEYIRDVDTDDRLLARKIKLQPHIFLKEYQTSIWVDGKYQIKDDLRAYIKKYERQESILCFPHFERNCVYSEAAACVYSHRGNKRKLIEQISAYYGERYPFDNGLYETGCLVRKHNDDICKKIMEDWLKELSKYSLRDQVSFPYVCWKNSFRPDICDLYINENEWLSFVWHTRYY